MTINGLHHAAISTPNIERLMSWYNENFGFEEVARTEWPKGSKQIDGVVGLKNSSAKQGFLKCGNIMIEFFEYLSPEPKVMDKNRPVNNHGHTHVCIDVTNIEDEYERLLKNGVKFHSPPQDFGEVKATYGRDIDGNVFEIQEIIAENHPAKVF
ncbi:VOC family protein [Rhodobiaceae bacterium]|jgi:catechol 2,3-dioxygenase-like lactoylglutathione lyase family enzyme|nr:VOC family protein [Rhodobiaceae bacterium]